MLSAIAAIAVAIAVANSRTDARPLNIAEVITAGDYPAVAVQNELEGTVVVRLRIDESGLVTSCKVTVSSGHRPLDEQTCALYRARAIFEPARDHRARAVASTYTQRVHWRLEGKGEPPLPRQTWFLRNIASFDANGRMIDCKIEAAGLAQPPDRCDAAVPAALEGKATTPQPVALVSITDTRFFPAETAKVTVPALLTDAMMIAQQISEVVIEPDGRVSDCRGLRYSGAAEPEKDVCGLLKHSRFDPQPGGGGMIGTFVVTMYVRRQNVS